MINSQRIQESDIGDKDDNYQNASKVQDESCALTDELEQPDNSKAEGPIDPENCFEILPLDEEIEMNNGKKPIEIYLEHCKNFAKNNLKREKIEVESFKIGPKHIRPELQAGGLSPIIKQEIIADIIMEQDDKIERHFSILKQRLFKKIYYYKGSMHMIVKTWERVKYTEQSKALSQDDEDSPEKIAELPDKDKKEDSDDPEFSKCDFFIKTIRCYDQFFKVQKEILVEHVSGIFDQFRLYDVSMYQWQDNIYYYKRHWNPKDGSSILRLYKLNLLTFEELLVENYDIKEEIKCELNATFS